MAPVRERAAACFVFGRSSFYHSYESVNSLRDCPVTSKVFLFYRAPLCFFVFHPLRIAFIFIPCILMIRKTTVPDDNI